ncbi:MAG TPA: amidohydrolase family protein, partial [Gemmatimonadales bacterium]
MKRLLAATLFLCAITSAAWAQAPADLIVYGRVWTGDPNHPWADAVAVRGERIASVGTRRQMLSLIGHATKVLDAGRNLVCPGFGDAHTHFLEGGFDLVSVDLRDAGTPSEFMNRIAEFARHIPAGTWITGGNWDHERWVGSPLPRREWIDSVTPGKPVFVQRLDGHMGIANSLALRFAGITRDTPNPPGGVIVKDSVTGEPTGVLKDNAMDRIFAVIPPPTPAQSDSALSRAMAWAAAHGVTTVHVMSDWDDFAVFRRAR